MPKKIPKLLMSLSRLIGTVNTYLILTILFFFFITPLGLIKRLFTKDQLRQPSKRSYWVKIDTQDNMERHF